jgi:transglutaminase-like putative cysteine protease
MTSAPNGIITRADMRLFIHHRTDYRFSEPQARLVQLLRLTPHSLIGQNVIDWRIDVDCNARLRPGRDGFGNETSMLYIDGPLESMGLAVTGEVLTEDRAGMIAGIPETLPPIVYRQSTRLTRADEAIIAFAAEAALAGGSDLDIAHRLNEAIADRLRVDPGRRLDARDAATVFADGHGKAQDIAQLFIAAARALGYPARYVSGHVFRHDEADEWREAAHAWVELHLGNYGWIGFDPSVGRCPDAAYVRVAIGLDYAGAAPLSGSRVGGGVEELEVGVRVGLSQVQAQD